MGAGAVPAPWPEKHGASRAEARRATAQATVGPRAAAAAAAGSAWAARSQDGWEEHRAVSEQGADCEHAKGSNERRLGERGTGGSSRRGRVRVGEGRVAGRECGCNKQQQAGPRTASLFAAASHPSSAFVSLFLLHSPQFPQPNTSLLSPQVALAASLPLPPTEKASAVPSASPCRRSRGDKISEHVLAAEAALAPAAHSPRPGRSSRPRAAFEELQPAPRGRRRGLHLRSSLIRASWTATRHAMAAIEQNAPGGRSGDRVPSQRTREYQARHHHQPERRSQVPRAPTWQPTGALHTAGSGRAEETHPPARGCSKEIQPSL
nr:uncharacterized protein LOC120973927 [Aegilops tauschii subsp. strangulata]